MYSRQSSATSSYLRGVRILELANELGEYCGKVLAGLGADVVKVEPPEGEETRGYGPFYQDEPSPDHSLYFWHYNFGKRGIALDLDSDEGRAGFAGIARTVDVVIDARPYGYMDARGIGYEQLRSANPGIIYVRMSPFGDDGPWSGYEGSDLIHLALGGVMMNCGYDPDPFGQYDTPPIAPQMWQAYHVAGEMTAMSVLAALNYRLHAVEGQLVSTSVHQAISANTELDIPAWVMLRQRNKRQTGRHSMPSSTPKTLSLTKDGRYLIPYQTYVRNLPSSWEQDLELLKRYGMQADLGDPKYDDDAYRRKPEVRAHIASLLDSLINRLLFDRELWREALNLGVPWAPVRRPEENMADVHWGARDTFFDVHHPELDATFTYPGAKWLCEDVHWRRGPRAPLLNEHTEEVLREWRTPSPRIRPVRKHEVRTRSASASGKPFALRGVRIVDLTWMLASAGAGRFLAAMGAEVIKVEHESRLDGMRFATGICPPGGRDERDRAAEALPTPEQTSPNQCGNFMEINAGKLGISLNLKSLRGRGLLEELIKGADMIVSGFSPGTMERMGFSYERLKALNPSIIYVQQSGFGQRGTYGRARAFGQTVQALTGLTEMSGLPEPFPPAGIGYSYLDWFGAYNMANAMLAALYRREVTGEACYIDASQGEAGLYLTGTSILDYSVNGRRWSRYGNRSPYKVAAPHGAYRTMGEDRWIAIAVFTEAQWESLVTILGSPGWASEDRFATLASRVANQNALDALLSEEASTWDGYALMEALQLDGVPAGVCQDAQDRCERDPQLRHLEWMVELEQSEIGTWPVRDHPVRLSATPAHMGGKMNRSGPSYGEDTDHVLSVILGLDPPSIAELRQSKVV